MLLGNPSNIFCVLIRKIKTTDLNYFDSGQNLVVRWLKTSNFETACLISCSGHIVASTSTRWFNDGETISRSHSIRRQGVVK